MIHSSTKERILSTVLYIGLSEEHLMEELFCLFLSEMLYKDIGGRSAMLKKAVYIGIGLLAFLLKKFTRQLG